MGKWAKIWFSTEHIGKGSKEAETDTYRRSSDSSKAEKTAHNPMPTEKVDIKTGNGDKK